MKKIYFLMLALVLGALTSNAKTIYFDANDWNADSPVIQAWTWGASDGWCDFELVEGDLYKAEIPDDRTGMKLVRRSSSHQKDSWDDSQRWNQTGDLTITSDLNLYVKTGWGDNDGYWSTYGTVEEKENLVFTVTVPEGTENCYICGSFNNWEKFIQMTPVEGVANQFTITINDLVKKSVQYKYSSGESWDYVELPAEGDYLDNRTYNEADVVAKWKATPTPVAIETVGADAAAAVYYNLQGAKVANPENGIFVKVQAGKATKVVL